MALRLLLSNNPNLDQLKILLTEDYLISETSLLHAALTNNHKEAQPELAKCIEFLLQEFRGLARRTLKELCSEKNPDLSAIAILIKRCSLSELYSALKAAIYHDNIDCSKLLFAAGLHYSSELLLNLHSKSNYATFAYLFDKIGCTFDCTSDTLNHFISIERTDFVNELLDNSGDLGTEYSFQLALQYDFDLTVIKRLIPYCHRDRTLEMACEEKRSEVIFLLLDVYPNVRKVLHLLFSKKKDIDVRLVIQQFIALGSDINEKCNVLGTPLKLACRNKLTSSVIELLRLGANFDLNIQYNCCIPAIQEALAVNFPQHYNSFPRNLDNIWMLNYKLREQIFTLMLCQLNNKYLLGLPIELMEIIFSHL